MKLIRPVKTINPFMVILLRGVLRRGYQNFPRGEATVEAGCATVAFLEK